MQIKQIVLASAALLLAMAVPALAAVTNVRVDDNNAYPESLGSANGTLYIGSSTKGVVYRAKAGQAYAEPWIPAVAGMPTVLGVLADAPSNTLYVCYNGKGTAAMKTYDLGSGKAKASYDFPDGGLCNDMALKNGDVYATDTIKGRILKLAKGAKAFTAWYSNADDPSLDGLVWAKDGKLYTDTYGTHHLIRIDVNADGSAGKGVVLTTDKPLYQPDGMRLSSSGKILMVEGQGHPDNSNLKLGRVDEVVVKGDSATINVIKDGYELPTAVTAIGDTIWVEECKSDYQRRPELKGKDAGEFHIYAVPFK